MNIQLIENVTSSFIHKFKKEPLLIFSPGRINLIGEHTDYNDGLVLPAAIDKGIVAAIQKSDLDVSTVYALNKDESIEFYLKNIKKDSNGSWKNYVLGVVAEIQKKGFILSPFNIVFAGDIPGGAGMSSSAALENSIVFGLNELFQLGLTKEEMVYISQKAKHNYVGVNCGIMDQYASIFGKKNRVLYLDCKTIDVIPLDINLEEHQIVLINTNIKHNLSESAYNDRRLACERVASLLNIKTLRDSLEEDLINKKEQILKEDYQKALYIIQENKRVFQASRAIQSNNIKQLGELMYEAHEGLKNMYKVSCEELDFLVAQTKDIPEILGARMVGGGFGGCTINLVKKDSKKSLNKIVLEYQLKFNIKPSIYFVEISDGVKLIKQEYLQKIV
jgi:galactokinase